MDFDKWLQRFVTSIEKIVFRLALIFVVLLFVVQAVLRDEESRFFLSKTDKLEGRPYQENIQEVFGRTITKDDEVSTPDQEETALVLELLPPPGVDPELLLLINDRIVAQLGEENIYIRVEHGDLLELIGDVPGDVPAVVRVVEVYGPIKAPQRGHEVKTFGERELLAWIMP